MARFHRLLPAAMLAALHALLPGGCAAAPAAPGRGSDPIAAVPDDWSLDATVLAGEEMPLAAPAHMRSARYVVLPDGSLHYGERKVRGERSRHGPPPPLADWLPPRTRTLSRAEAAALWQLAGETGIADPDRGVPPINLDRIEPPPDGIAYLFACTAEGRRWIVVEKTRGAPEAGDPAVRLVRRLAALAWATDRLPVPAGHVPVRYEMGPDPYARYRTP